MLKSLLIATALAVAPVAEAALNISTRFVEDGITLTNADVPKVNNEVIYVGTGLANVSTYIPSQVTIGRINPNGQSMTMTLLHESKQRIDNNVRNHFLNVVERSARESAKEVFGEQFNSKAVATYINLHGVENRIMVVYRYMHDGKFVDVAALTYLDGKYIKSRAVESW